MATRSRSRSKSTRRQSRRSSGKRDSVKARNATFYAKRVLAVRRMPAVLRAFPGLMSCVPWEPYPNAQLREFPDEPAGFQALTQGQMDAYANDSTYLAGLIVRAPNPSDWVIVGDFYSYEPYGMAMWKNESDFRNVVNNGLMEAIESGKYFELYEKWFGLKGELPYPPDGGATNGSSYCRWCRVEIAA
jgi:Bacterial extracellular solute-binding proteins, family 3